MTIRSFFSLIFFIVIISCNDAIKPIGRPVSPKIKNRFANVIQVKQFGDSIRLEVEKQQDVIIKHYIDLKGKTDNGFDDSYNEICTYNSKQNNSKLKSDFYVRSNGFKFYLDKNKVISYCDSAIKKLTTDYDRDVIKPRYEDLKKYIKQQDKSSANILKYLPSNYVDLLVNFDLKIVDEKLKEIPRLLLIEYYKNEFSAGKNFYIIRDQGDSVAIFHSMDYIN